MTHEKNVKLSESIPERNKAMCKSIAKYLALGKKVFVIGGLSHFCDTPFTKTDATREIKDFLHNLPFVIVTKDEWYQQFSLSVCNPDLEVI